MQHSHLLHTYSSLFHIYSSMNQREQEEFLLHYGPRKERKAIKKRRKAARRAQAPDQPTRLRTTTSTEPEAEILCGTPKSKAGEYIASDESGQPYHPNLLTLRWWRLLDELGIRRVRRGRPPTAATTAR